MSATKYILILACLFTFVHARAQFVNHGSDPARYKWNIVKLPHYNLVYPRGIDSMAYKYALYLENVYPHIRKTIGEPVNVKFPVVLHPGNMSSNGLVSWAPRRMELITTPSSRQEAQRWDKHLVVHESRHVFQTGKVMHGMFKPLYYLIGEQAAGVAAFFLPTWFLEGDAVGIETGLSNAGRGRLPEFHMTYRAQMLDGDNFFSFDKWYLGSYKDYTGDFYSLGYHLTSFARYKYGSDIWDKTTSRYVTHFFHIPMFSNAFKHYSGVNIDNLYKQTFSFLKDEWERQDTGFITPRHLSRPVKKFTSYRYPQALNDSTIIAVKSGIQDINALVAITNGKEEHLRYLGNINSRLILNNGRVYWTEIVSGLRWAQENFSVLKYYDFISKRIVTVTPGRRYLSPSINSTGRIAAVSRFTMEGKAQIVLLDTENGNEIDCFNVPDHAFAKELTFAGDDTVIAIAVNDSGIELLQLNIENRQWSELLQTTSANITSPVWREGKLYFESGLNGTNNIYYLDLSDSQTYRLASSRFGAFNPAFSTDGRQLLFSDYQLKGYRAASLPIDSIPVEKADFSRPHRFTFAETLARQEQFNIDSAELDPVAFNPEPYRKGLHTFKIHSWAPFYYDVTEAMNTGADDLSTIVKPGAMILTQNTLNTAIGQAGWYYRKGYHHGKLTFSYMGWFPVINLDADYGGKSFAISWGKNEEGRDVAKSRDTNHNLLEAKAQIYLPFNLTRNHYTRGVQPSVSYYFTNNKYQQYSSRKFSNFQYLLSEVLFYNYRRLAVRDILPRWGYQLRLQYMNTPFNTENYGSLYTARLTTYWPGLIRNHALMLRLGYQYQYLDNKALYIPKRLLETPRGYNYLYQTHQQIAFKADYAFSIVSPDISIGQLMYIRRFRTNLFYDLSKNQAGKNSNWNTQSSFGADFIFDWNVLRMSFPLTTGVRLIQPIDYGRFQTEMLFSISF
ncbi:MAG: hypothetical protein LBH58_13770 [Tannerellaceae bacterium]|jgi:hypothetical protein|nr:hypothetical protein [Tannerellaceae bacterium]